uniref:RNA helicase n=1 Tax=Meloidogyne javanica TaxID=6303 RepID=A0A915MXI2_MELJA
MDEGATCFSQQLEDRYFRTLDDETPIVHVNGFNNCVGQPLPKSPNIFEGIEGDSTAAEKLPKKSYTSTALKNAIYRNKGNVPAGPAFEQMNADESRIGLKGGDGTFPKIRDFTHFVEPLKNNLLEKGYSKPTLVQRSVIPIIEKKRGYDLIARAQTGTGKTGAFLFPIIHLLHRRKQKMNINESPLYEPNAIIIAPTRELTQQLGDTAKVFSRGTCLKVVCSYGEIRISESLEEMRNGFDIFVSTMGRIMQFISEEKNKQIHRTLMFSATFDGIVEEYAGRILQPNYFMISIGGREVLPQTVKQKFVVSTKYQKFSVLCDEILSKLKPKCKGIYKDVNGVTWRRLSKKVAIFCNSRRMTNWLALKLSIRGWKSIPTSGERSQRQRQEALVAFEKGDCDILVSTSVISRGLNLVGLELVVNYEMPKTFDDFVHRTGRTGRAGNVGRAITIVDPDCLLDLRLVTELIKEMQKENIEVPSALIELNGPWQTIIYKQIPLFLYINEPEQEFAIRLIKKVLLVSESKKMISRRGLASVAAAYAKPNPLVEPIQQKTSRLPNGMTISSVDLQGAVSQLVFAFRSGSRYQQPDEGGVAHMLRNCIGSDSDNYLGLRLLWQTAQTGANLFSKLSKDLLCVQMSVNRTQAPIALSVLGEIVQPAIKPWDIYEVHKGLEIDLEHQTAEDITFENLHRAAFRNGSLANQLLCKSYEIGSDTNVGHKRLQSYVLSHHRVVPDGAGHPANPSPFLGGEVRQFGPGKLAHIAIVGEGAAFKDDKAVAIQAVLAQLIGKTGQYTNYQNIAQPSIVHRTLFKAANHNPFHLSQVNISHSDIGLVGFYLVAEGEKIFPYVKAAVQGLRELAEKTVDQELIQIAKQTLALQTLSKFDSSELLALDQASQVMAKGTAQSPEEFVNIVQSVTAEDIKKAATKLCAKLALSAYGQINQTPYLDEI